MVQNLGRTVDDEDRAASEASPEVSSPNANGNSNSNSTNQGNSTAGLTSACGKMMTMHEPSKAEVKPNGLIKEFGRLVVDEGRSRYVSNTFWTSLSEEVAEMQDILDDPTDEEDDFPSPGSGDSGAANHQGFLFSFSSMILSLRNYHPPNTQITIYWDLYKSNVAPVMKLFHTPTTESLVFRAANDLDHLSKPTETLLFSIYFAVVTSLSPDDCIVVLGVERASTLRKYRFAAEQAFARANFLNTQDIMVLQAMTLFLIAVRRSDDSRFVWTLTGLLIRIATSLGVHRDGAQFGLSPFETEIRRRLWWQICTLDVRTSEDHGCDPSIVEASFDTKFPLNINDVDISASTSVTPTEHEDATEMTFDLIRYSVSTTVRRLSYAPPGPGPCRVKSNQATLEDKEHVIENLHQYIEQKYLRHLDTTNPLHWVAATVSRLIMAKMWLVVHHPLQRSDAGAGLPQETRDRLFRTSIEVVEFSRLLETERATLKWGWLFRTYVQWHALAFALSQLCMRTEGPQVDKAWVVIDGVFDDWGGAVSSHQRGMMWKPLRKLMARARQARHRALERRAQFPLDGSLGPAITAPLITEPGAMMNGSAIEQQYYLGGPILGDYPDMTTAAVSSNLGATGMMDANNLQAFIDQAQSANNLTAADPALSGNIMASGPMTSSAPWPTGLMDLNTNNIPLASPSTTIPTTATTGLANDPMMTTTPLPENAWWDDMMKEFQMDGGREGNMTFLGDFA